MYRATVLGSFLLSCFGFLAHSASLDAASYQKTDGTIVNPLQSRLPVGGDHPFGGNDLRPSADLRGADLGMAALGQADLAGADMSGAILTDSDLMEADLSGAVLLGAAMDWINMEGVVARDANFSGALFDNSYGAHGDFSGADFTGSDMTTFDLRNADLIGAVLINAIADSVEFNNADLRDACFTCADITFSNFNGANVEGADFVNAYYYNEFVPIGLFNPEGKGVLNVTWPDVPEVCRSAAVPEPGSLLLALLGLALLPHRRRRK